MINKAKITQEAYTEFSNRESISETLGIKIVSVQEGGLFNSILKLASEDKNYYFKQYLDATYNETYSNIPKLPAQLRLNLAVDVQNKASEAASNIVNVNIPKILNVDYISNSFLMEEAISSDSLYSTLESGRLNFGVLTSLALFLAGFHKFTFRAHEDTDMLKNHIFRDFKLKIQYEDIASKFDFITSEKIINCVNEYKDSSECILHGDLNSRNILISGDEISVIDFEQSHLGSPVYDIAYILCEIFISLYVYKPEKISEYLSGFYLIYTKMFPDFLNTRQDKNLLKHFAIQLIYRFLGPSKDHWTAYVNEDIKDELIYLSEKMINSNMSFCDFFEV